jgi:hypothetical protein
MGRSKIAQSPVRRVGLAKEAWEEEHAQLRKAFTSRGIVGSNLGALHLWEEGRELSLCTSYRGYRLVHQCFSSFFLDSIEKAEPSCGRLDADPWFSTLLLVTSGVFTRMRAAEISYLHGYPLDAYALLRDLKDRALYLAAVLRGLSTLERVLGLQEAEGRTGDGFKLAKAASKFRRNEHHRIHDILVGASTGLPQSLLEDVLRWEALFHEEVHLSLHSFVLAGSVWTPGGGILPTAAARTEHANSMYMNRSLEVAWCLLRVLPLLQIRPHQFGADWEMKWNLLDRNLRLTVMSVADEGRELVASVAAWIECVFSFDPANHFPNQ